jgi:TRAP-type C4-dicarboxylate transport system substrate-binding protein
MKGLKIRVPQLPIMVDTYRAFGSEAVALAVTELYTAVKTGVVDGCDDPPAVLFYRRLGEVTKYVTMLNSIDIEWAVVFNKETWDSYPADVQDLLERCIHESSSRASWEEMMFWDKAVWLCEIEFGTKVYFPTSEEIQQFRDAAASLREKYAKKVGLGFANALYKQVGLPQVK